MMSFKDSLVLFIFAFVIISSHGDESPAELYWNLRLGNLEMPKVLKASLQLGLNEGTLNTQFQVHPIDGGGGGGIGGGGDVSTYNYYANHTSPTQYPVHSYDGSVDVLNMNASYVSPTQEDNENVLPQDGRVLYFTEEKLSTPGSTMKLLLGQIDSVGKFLPLQIKKSIEAASNKLQMIQNILSVNPKSNAANFIKQMLIDCAKKGIKDEVRYCATSLEDMVDFVISTSNSGSAKYMVVSTEEEQKAPLEYKILKSQIIGKKDNRTMICHKLNNPYAVFLCHNIKSTDVYGVSMVGANGNQTHAIAVCHKDTSDMYRGHIAFRLLKIEPGSMPICHFLSGNSAVWLQK